MSPKKIGNIGAVLLCVLVATQSLGLQNELNLISNSIAQMSDIQQNSGRTMGIYVPAHIPISTLAALDGETIGIMAQRDDEGIPCSTDQFGRSRYSRSNQKLFVFTTTL